MTLLEVGDDLGNTGKHGGQHSGEREEGEVLHMKALWRKNLIGAIEQANRQTEEQHSHGKHVGEGLAGFALGEARSDSSKQSRASSTAARGTGSGRE